MHLARFVVLVVLLGCVSQLTPAAFDVSTADGQAAHVEQVLATFGMQVERKDTQSGILETAWESTGENSDGTIWAMRYIVTIAPGELSTRIGVAMDLRTCEAGLGVNPNTGRLDGTSCTRLPPGTTPVSYQNRLDDFAIELHAAL